MNWKLIPPHLRPLKHWPPATRKRVETLADEYNVTDPAGLVLLQSFGSAEAREAECRGAIEKQGVAITDKYGQTKNHPLLSIERDARAAKLAAIKALHFDLEPIKAVGRPAGR
jgi:hypothetical protein